MRRAFLCLLLFGVAFAHARATVSPEQRVRQLLASQKLIRLFVDAAPGMGHQSASANVLRRLREMGYGQNIEVIYADPVGDDGEMRRKMAILFPGFNRYGPDVQHLRAQQLSFVSFSSFEFDHAEHAELAIAGASDHDFAPYLLNATMLLRLQPPGWGGERSLKIDQGGQTKVVKLPEFKDLGLHFDLAETPAALRENSSVETSLPAEKLSGLRAIDLERGKVDTAVFYGHGLYQGTDQLTRYLEAIATAHRDEPRAFSNGVVVPIFLETPAVNLSKIRDSMAWTPLEQTVTAVAIDDPKLPTLLKTLGAGKILAVMVGQVPPEIFTYFLTNSTLAPVTGGRNSMNLMALTGRPYFTSNPWEAHHFGSSDATPPQHLQAHVAGFDEARRAHQAMYPAAGGQAVSQMASFLTAARYKHSTVSRLFSASRLRNEPASDLLTRGLLKVIEHRPSGFYRATRPVRGTCERALRVVNDLIERLPF